MARAFLGRWPIGCVLSWGNLKWGRLESEVDSFTVIERVGAKVRSSKAALWAGVGVTDIRMLGLVCDKIDGIFTTGLLNLVAAEEAQ